ncbi:MAG TPA: chromosome segregation protein SMC [Clostridiales bacterium]|nr:chromosome segregation protein SMC [Clostridiales bacterium]
MHLKSLEIQGFKSFPERTVIEFDRGVTAIIGPNGSGKSNVTDAIRWVLGEQSVKTLRGSRMEDVIFTGTQSRRPMSFAEVTMIIDNSDGKLPVEYTEIQVTRRLYRSGESEYLLNRSICRLRDIAMLFMDTGLGRDGYSIVGQGRVDDILSHRSEDRRRIFEEASGIVKFKTRKDEAEHKLQNTEQNLLRINDIINELEDRLEPLVQQAEAARRYLALHDELKSLEIALMLDTIDQHQQKLVESRLEMQLLQEDLEQENRSLVELKEKNHQTTELIRHLEEQMSLVRDDFNQISSQVGVLQGEEARADDRIRQLRQNLQIAAAEEAELNQSLGSLDRELAGRQIKEENLRRQLVLFRRQLNEAETEMQSVLQTLDAAAKETENLKVRQDLLQEKLYEHRGLLTQTRGQNALVESRRKTITQEQREMTSDRDRLGILCEETETQLQQIRKKAAEREASLALLRQSLELSRQTCTAQAKQLDQTRQLLQNREYRLNTLISLEKNLEGYGEAVRRLIRQAESDRQFGQGIRGTLGSLIRAGQNYELAIETALGPAIQNVVTDTEETAARLIEYLKTTRSGRATFLPIASIKGRTLETNILGQLSGQDGYIGLASQLVQSPPDLRNIIDFLLGRVVIANNLEQAVKMARKTSYACRIVTLEGDVLNPGGAMTGGYTHTGNSGVLSRSREIEDLKAEIQRLTHEQNEQENEIPALELKMQELARQLADLEKQALDDSHLLVREEARLESLRQESEKTRARQQLLQAEDEQLQNRCLQIDKETDQIQEESSRMEQEIALIRQSIQDQVGANQAEQDRRDELRESIADLRVSLNSIEESLQAAQELAGRIEQEKLSQQQRLDRHRRDQTDGQAEIERLHSEITLIQTRIAEKKSAGEACSQAARELAERKGILESEQSAFIDHLEQSASRSAALQSEIGRAEGKASRFEGLVDDVKNRMWEEYELTADQASGWRRPLENRNEAGRQVAQLKNSMKTLGPVNVAAIDEYQAVQERFRFMTGQRDDIEASRHKLTAVIEELTEAMKQQFVDHFQLINENFKTVFSELFGGGMAEVSLEDENDVLACGIEIRAQPPGKKLQNLLLLSGGERCLTAIALLFAILKLRPTPFCVLDEVEAALDDANVSRFTDYIRRYADESQFILVTHRKGTMEAADRLYGVTMQERGISRILSMQLSE